ncbi:MAG TPA: hypothetical protein VNV36_06140 [Pseudomonas sp.]|uniref:hypothetical protein n=1 Tax=Pseudomonas sp. TaxID=306 RepID=UPI002D0A97B2|nr:hypothetical protein [Pseudomonas sp.]HWH86335.1 hypothetical protein [Pseudomonas sp.]
MSFTASATVKRIDAQCHAHRICRNVLTGKRYRILFESATSAELENIEHHIEVKTQAELADRTVWEFIA